MGEVKRHPYTSVAALLCLAGMPVMFTMKADAGDVQALQQQIADVAATVRQESVNSELRAVRAELFDISLRISTLEKMKMEVDVLLYKRRDELLATQRRLEARVQAMEAQQRQASNDGP